MKTAEEILKEAIDNGGDKSIKLSMLKPLIPQLVAAMEEYRSQPLSEQTESAELTDLKQYVTNLLYFVHNEGRNMDSKFFDKWVEESTNDLSAYFAQSHPQVTVPSDEDIHNYANKVCCVADEDESEHAMIDVLVWDGFVQGAKAMRNGKIKPTIEKKEEMDNNLKLFKMIGFKELIEHGRNNGANIVNGMPWSWKINGKLVTHERDDCYLIETIEGQKRFEPGDQLWAQSEGLKYFPYTCSDTHAPGGCSM